MNDTAASGGYETTRFNALRHGVLSRYTVLPWEDEGEYRVLLDALAAEHSPRGPTEEHLVEELAGILWRKRRLRLAESAAFRRGLKEILEPFSGTAEAALAHTGLGQISRLGDAVRGGAADNARALAVLDEEERRAGRALRILRRNGPDAYERAIAALDDAARERWQEQLDPDAETEDWPEEAGEDEPCRPDAASLRHFLEEEAHGQRERRRAELLHRPLIRAQAFGEALDANSLERLARYEAHLDRKLERMLAMLLKLQDVRAAGAGG